VANPDATRGWDSEWGPLGPHPGSGFSGSPTPLRPKTGGTPAEGPELGMAASKPTPQRSVRSPFPSQWMEI